MATARKSVTVKKTAVARAASAATKRVQLTEASPYFAMLSEKDLPFVSSGCLIFDCMLGGGYVLGRVANIVGDKSTGKTLLAMEAMANFHRKYAEGRMFYRECEAAWDADYARALGLPDEVEVLDGDDKLDTVEDFFADLDKVLDDLNGAPGIYILDSLDALSDREEMKRALGDATYGTGKAKLMSEGFRKVVRRLEQSRLLLIVVSQIRDNIGAMFGAKHTRAGGKALDFYASQIIWLAETGKKKRVVLGIERIESINIKANCKKNKVGLAYRQCEFPILLGYGIDDVSASIEWLFKTMPDAPVLEELRLSKTGWEKALRAKRDEGYAELNEWREKLSPVVVDRWREIEITFLPKVGKYA